MTRALNCLNCVAFPWIPCIVYIPGIQLNFGYYGRINFVWVRGSGTSSTWIVFCGTVGISGSLNISLRVGLRFGGRDRDKIISLSLLRVEEILRLLLLLSVFTDLDEVIND